MANKIKLEQIFTTNGEYIRENGEKLNPKIIDSQIINIHHRNIGFSEENIRKQIHEKFNELSKGGGEKYEKVNSYSKKRLADDKVYSTDYYVKFYEVKEL